MKQLVILWKFSRPHTIIGSVISIYTLYMIVYDKHASINFTYLLMALIVGISCNIFIVGINQIADVEIDRINKPKLPIPAGVLTKKEAKVIVISALLISWVISFLISPYLFFIVLLATAIGWAYSMPPLYLKQHHLPAAFAIATVRGVLLNACGFMVFNYLANHTLEMPKNVKILTLFIIAFSIVISWFKDLSDMEGDSKYRIRTLAIIHSPKVALIAGNLLVICAYIFTIYMKYFDLSNPNISSFETSVLLYGHILLFVLFVMNAFSISLETHQSIKLFYKRFWWFFFAEYLLYLIAYTLK